MAVKKQPSILNGLLLSLEGSDGHQAACKFTRQQYRRRLGCHLQHVMPATFSLYDQGRLRAATGYRPARDEELFLEQYLDAPVETLLAGSVDRSTIVEVGGFAAVNRMAAYELMSLLAPALFDLGFRTVVCTVNKAVHACLDNLGIESICLGKANPERLTGNEDWGSYYAGDPVVLAGDIEAGMRAIESLLKPESARC